MQQCCCCTCCSDRVTALLHLLLLLHAHGLRGATLLLLLLQLEAVNDVHPLNDPPLEMLQCVCASCCCCGRRRCMQSRLRSQLHQRSSPVIQSWSPVTCAAAAACLQSKLRAWRSWSKGNQAGGREERSFSVYLPPDGVPDEILLDAWTRGSGFWIDIVGDWDLVLRTTGTEAWDLGLGPGAWG